MKQLKRPERPALSQGDDGSLPLAELKVRRRAQKECGQRIEALKMRIFRIAEQHMEQTVRLTRRWLSGDDE
ncbi:MAG: flagellar M-ring protein FliF [Desulfovibrio sp.]|jgi:hypothetical protein|nr:flagellar M-ring protein FliF [Desulfovibrio sp.]